MKDHTAEARALATRWVYSDPQDDRRRDELAAEILAFALSVRSATLEEAARVAEREPRSWKVAKQIRALKGGGK